MATRRLLVALVSFALVASSCGAGEDGDTADSTSTSLGSTSTEQVTSTPTTTAESAPGTTQLEPAPATEGLASVVVGSAEGRANRNLPYVLVDVNDSDLPFVAYFVNDTGELWFVHCEDPACSVTSTATYVVDEPRWLQGWPSIGWSQEGLPVIGVGPSAPVGPEQEVWTSLLACADPACGDYEETRIDNVAFWALDVAADETTQAIGVDVDYDPAVGVDGLNLFVCDDSSCPGGPVGIDVNGWKHPSTPHRLAVVGGNPVFSYLRSFGGPEEAASVGVVSCLDPTCTEIETVTVIEGSGEHALAAGVDGPVVLLHDVFSQATPVHHGLVLRVWDRDFNEAAVVELYDPARIDVTASLGAESIAVGPDGRPVAVWVRETLNGPPETAPQAAIPFLGAAVADLDELPSEVLSEFGITAQSGVFVDEPVAGTAAAEAGLEGGDVITSLDDTPIESWVDFDSVVAATSPGQSLQVGYERSGQVESTEVTLGAGFSELLVARCDDRHCRHGTIATLVQTPLEDLSFYASVALDADGHPVIVYRDPADVTVARCTDPDCGSEAITIDRW